MGTLNSSTLGVVNLKPTTSTLTGNLLPATTTIGGATTSAGFWVIERTPSGELVVNPKKLGTSMGMGLATTTTLAGINCQYGLDAEYQHQETQVVSPLYDNISSEYLETATYQYESHLQVAVLKNGLYSVEDKDLKETTSTAFEDDNNHVQSPIECIKQATQDALYQGGIGGLQISAASDMSWIKALCAQIDPEVRKEYLAAIDAKEAELQAGTPKEMVKRLQTSSKHL